MQTGEQMEEMLVALKGRGRQRSCHGEKLARVGERRRQKGKQRKDRNRTRMRQ